MATYKGYEIQALGALHPERGERAGWFPVAAILKPLGDTFSLRRALKWREYECASADDAATVAEIAARAVIDAGEVDRTLATD
jgi:hypothetical protein